MMRAGTDLWEAAGYLGMTVQTLEAVYGHHRPQHLSGAKNAFAKMPRLSTVQRFVNVSRNTGRTKVARKAAKNAGFTQDTTAS
jgi:hypothetical protein